MAPAKNGRLFLSWMVNLKRSRLNQSRFIIGIILVIIAALMLLFAHYSYATAGVIAIAVLGLVSIAISRK